MCPESLGDYGPLGIGGRRWRIQFSTSCVAPRRLIVRRHFFVPGDWVCESGRPYPVSGFAKRVWGSARRTVDTLTTLSFGQRSFICEVTISALVIQRLFGPGSRTFPLDR